MPKSVIFLPPAQKDITAIHDYYESQLRGLGADFLLRMEAAVSRIELYPESCPILIDPFRRLLIRRFPYALFYEIEDQILVHAVFHCAQNPEAMEQRLKKS